jgi:hypothetical protein
VVRTEIAPPRPVARHILRLHVQPVGQYPFARQPPTYAAQSHDLYPLTFRTIAVEPVVLSLKRLGQRRDDARIEGRARERNSQRVILADIAQVGRQHERPMVGPEALFLQRRRGLGHELAKQIVQARQIRRDRIRIVGSDQVVLYLSEQQAERAEQTWQRRDDHLLDAKLLRDIERVHPCHRRPSW